MSFTTSNELSFIDGMQFLSYSWGSLVKNIAKNVFQ